MNFDWKPSDKNINKITESDAKFIFEQAEKYLKEVVETNILIVNRTTTLITISVGFMLALTGFLFNRYSIVYGICDAQLITCFATMLYIFYLCKILVDNIQSKEYHIVGSEPKKLFIDAFFNTDDVPTSDRTKYFYLNEIAVCQNKIKKNVDTNDKRWLLFNKSLKMLLYTPLVIIVIYILATILTSLFGCIPSDCL